MLNVKSVDEVKKIITDNFTGYITGTEEVSVENAMGRILAVDIPASEDIPGFNRSSVDGYAVFASSTFGASESIPAQLELVGEVQMGIKPEFALKPGQAAYVPTGGELPENADAMVMIEYTENLNDGFIYIEKASSPGNHVVFKGDDIKMGSTVIKAGTTLRPQDVGILAALGFQSVSVRKKLRIGIISTGDEIIAIHEKPQGSQVRDVNSYTLYTAIVKLGAEPKMYGIVKDSFDSIRQVTENALQESDIVLISGGSSAGFRDETSKVIDSLGLPGLLVHGVAVKPGKPTILGRIGQKAVLGLPGHPAAACIIFNIFGRQLINTMQGRADKFDPSVSAVMALNYPSNNGREEYLTVKLETVGGRSYAHPVLGKSGLISLLSSADGYVHISRGSEGLNEGAEVKVILFS